MIPYDKNKFRMGGICAAMVPVSIGIALLIRTIKMDDPDDWFIYSPIIISFIFIAPIVASICVRHLKKNAPVNREDILTTSFIKSTKANFWTAIVYNVIFTIILLVAGGHPNTHFKDIALFFFGSSIVQAILWLIVTIPLSFICAIIFELIARPRTQIKSPS
jgi:hypothetical protein